MPSRLGVALVLSLVAYACSENGPSSASTPGGAGGTGAGTGGVAPVGGGGSGGSAGSSAGTLAAGGTLAGAGSGGGGGSDTAGAGGADPLPPVAPYDWVGVIGTGQSISVGVSAGFDRDAQPYSNLKL